MTYNVFSGTLNPTHSKHSNDTARHPLHRCHRKSSKQQLTNFPDITLQAPFCSGYLEKSWACQVLVQDHCAEGTASLSCGHELVMGDGFSDATEAKWRRRQTVKLNGNHEEADTRLILHSCETVSEGKERLIVICSDPDVPLLLLHLMTSKAVEVWMAARIAKKQEMLSTAHCIQ